MIEMGNNFLGIKIWILNDGPENINKFLKCNEGGNLLEPEPTFFGWSQKKPEAPAPAN